MVSILQKKKVVYFAFDSHLKENSEINVLERMVCEAILRRRNGDYQSTMC